MAVAFSPDGKTVLTGSGQDAARLWDAATGKPLGTPLRHQDAVTSVAFSPDGKTVLTGSWDNMARLWDGDPAAAPSIRALFPHQGPVSAVAFHPDGRTLLTRSDDRTAHLWDVPAPWSGRTKQVVLWAQAITGLEMDGTGIVRPLDSHALRGRRQLLVKLGGPPLP